MGDRSKVLAVLRVSPDVMTGPEGAVGGSIGKAGASCVPSCVDLQISTDFVLPTILGPTNVPFVHHRKKNFFQPSRPQPSTCSAARRARANLRVHVVLPDAGTSTPYPLHLGETSEESFSVAARSARSSKREAPPERVRNGTQRNCWSVTVLRW